MSREDIDEVVLVGGSTRVPLIKRRLREYFGKELNDHIDPDVTVAYGAASILD
jgi:molecular chaperone DnaK (HSP70)